MKSELATPIAAEHDVQHPPEPLHDCAPVAQHWPVARAGPFATVTETSTAGLLLELSALAEKWVRAAEEGHASAAAAISTMNVAAMAKISIADLAHGAIPSVRSCDAALCQNMACVLVPSAIRSPHCNPTLIQINLGTTLG